ncbi:MAG: hypothetical protein Q9208_002183 [Pyrenodesmia sp. 3 TL-2023]
MLWCRALPDSSSLADCDAAWWKPSRSPFQLQKLFRKASAFLTPGPVPNAYLIPEPSSLPEGGAQTIMPSQMPDDRTTDRSESSAATLTALPLNDSAFTVGRGLSSPQLKQDTAVDIRYANQGLSLLQAALDSLPQHPVFARQVYVHAIMYLLQGLPPRESLSGYEVMSLQSAIPDMTRSSSVPAEQCLDDIPHASSRETPPSLLRRSFSTIIAFVIVIIRLLTPYIRALVSAVALCDRQYGLSVRVMGFTSVLAQRVWNSVDLAFLVWALSEVARGVGEGWRMGSEGRETEMERKRAAPNTVHSTMARQHAT